MTGLDTLYQIDWLRSKGLDALADLLQGEAEVIRVPYTGFVRGGT